MKKYFSGLGITGLLICWILALPVAYTQDTQKHRNHKRNNTDTMSDTRMQKDNRPSMKKTDSLPVPDPGRIPSPDSFPHK